MHDLPLLEKGGVFFSSVKEIITGHHIRTCSTHTVSIIKIISNKYKTEENANHVPPQMHHGYNLGPFTDTDGLIGFGTDRALQ